MEHDYECVFVVCSGHRSVSNYDLNPSEQVVQRELHESRVAYRHNFSHHWAMSLTSVKEIKSVIIHI